jgi:hypothetical protein
MRAPRNHERDTIEKPFAGSHELGPAMNVVTSNLMVVDASVIVSRRAARRQITRPVAPWLTRHIAEGGPIIVPAELLVP